VCIIYNTFFNASDSGKKVKKFNVKQLITDCGGEKEVARLTNKFRTAPYRWANQGFVTTKVLEVLKTENPKLNINKYFI